MRVLVSPTDLVDFVVNVDAVVVMVRKYVAIRGVSVVIASKIGGNV